MLVILALALPAVAQKMGSANARAPIVEQTLTLGDDELMLRYASITWGEGQTMALAMTEGARGARTRSLINRAAESSPLGVVRASTPFLVAGKEVPAGNYGLCFTIGEDLTWTMTLVPEADGDKVGWPLPLVAAPRQSRRLRIVLGAGEEDGTGQLHIAFGGRHCWIGLKPHAGDE